MLHETAVWRGFWPMAEWLASTAYDNPSLTVIWLKHSLHPMATRKA
jgi:hypothetical protein